MKYTKLLGQASGEPQEGQPENREKKIFLEVFSQYIHDNLFNNKSTRKNSMTLH